jgi:large subunit ribosomal protein L29
MVNTLKAKEVRELSDEELASRLVELKEELAKQRGQVASGTRPENPGKVRPTRKSIARILTIQRQREKSAEKKAKKEVQKKG